MSTEAENSPNLVKNGAEEPPVKKRKHSGENTDKKEGVPFNSFQDFIVDKVLNDNVDSKRIVVKGRFGNKDGTTLAIMEKEHFPVSTMQEVMDNKFQLKNTFINDIYQNYSGLMPIHSNSVKVTLIHPATQKHIEKYGQQTSRIIDETGELYRKVTLPYIEKAQFNIQWVFNILNHSTESERIVYEDTDPETGFILLPDMKWDGKNLDNLYLLAIVHKRGIRSVRDLTSEHLPLLKSIMKNGTEAIEKKYGVSRDLLKIYFHYQPSYYHLHVHFSHVKASFGGLVAPNAILLSNVISSIEVVPDYYQRVTLPFQVKENDKLYLEYAKQDAVSSQ